MCFSASASFIAGASLSCVGVATVNKTKTKSELPYATLPLVFALQQGLEGVVWLTFTQSAPIIHLVAVYGFTFFAFVFWPVFVPFVVKQLETEPWRQKVLSYQQVVGLIVGVYFLFLILRFPIKASIVHQSIVYDFFNPFGYQMFILYFIAVCVSFLLSSHKCMKLFGILVIFSLVLTFISYSTYVISIWCFFAAILSSIVYLHFVSRDIKVYIKQHNIRLSLTKLIK